VFVLVGVSACGLTVTKGIPAYDDLDQPEKSAVDLIFGELSLLNEQIKARTPTNIENILDKNKIHVSFEGLIFSGNLGDGIIHVATWDNLDDGQREMVRGWFEEPTSDGAHERYAKFFYQFLGTTEGMKQATYNLLTKDWVFLNRSVFNIQRDSIRGTLSHFAAIGRRDEVWGFLAQSCEPIKRQLDAHFGPTFGKDYLRDHFQELINPANPSGYMYYLCKWIEHGIESNVDLTTELAWVQSLPSQ
jgi:hypothetical protein